jgi:hypothetical protein
MRKARKGRTAELDVVVVLRSVDSLNGTADVESLDGVVEVMNGGVSRVVGAENLLSFVGLVGLVDGGDCRREQGSERGKGEGDEGERRTGEDSEGRLVPGVAKGDAGTGGELEGVDLLLGDVEGDGHREKSAVSETEGLNNAARRGKSVNASKEKENKRDARLVVLLAHEALEGRETTVQDELQVAELALGKTDVGELLRLGEELLAKGSIADVKVLEDTTVGSVGHLQSGRESGRRRDDGKVRGKVGGERSASCRCFVSW